MSDVHNLGDFQTIKDVWKKFPNGGGFGDYVTIIGVRHDWDEYKSAWGNETTEIDPPVPEVLHHDLEVQGSGKFRDGIQTGEYVERTSGASIDKDGNGDFRTVSIDTLIIKDPITGEHIPLSAFIKKYKTELPPDWADYEQIIQFDSVRILAFDPLTQDKFYTTIGALKKLISDSIAAGGTGGGTFVIQILRSDDPEGVPTDNNVLSSLKTLMAIQAAINPLIGQFLSKTDDDTAQGVITFLKGLITAALEVGGESLFRGLARVLEGIQFGESFAGGLAGFGGKINGAGYGELRGLTVWEFFKATEFIFNKVEINIGDKWNAPGRGKIKSVDTEQRFVELELEDGEIGTIDVDDICMGIFHSVNLEENATSDYDDARGNRAYAGFFTSYFRIIQVMDEQRKSKFRYELRPVSSSYPAQYHPCALMKFTSYGNFTKKERQRSNYETLSYHRYLKDVRDWEFTINNIAAQRGDLSNLNVFGLNMEGYSEYINNVYFTGIIYQLSQQIQDELSKQQIGGKNLLREYDIRFGFKYWGGTGDFTEVNLDTLQNQPYLNVSPAQILWVFPEREADVNVESNTNWLVE